MSHEDTQSRADFLAEAFFAHLKRRNKAAGTAKRWRPELRRFSAWVGESALTETTSADLDAGFLTACEGYARLENRTIRDEMLKALSA